MKSRKPRVGDFVRANHPRGGHVTGRIVKRVTTGDFARAYGPRFELDTGYSISVGDVVEIMGAKKRAKNPDDRLTMAHLDMEGHALAKSGGDHVELHPGLDLWMRGARYGTIKKISADGIATVKMDHPGVKKLQRIPTSRLKLTTNRNPQKRGRKVRRTNPKGAARKGPPLTGFQVAALRQGKVLYLSGIGLSDNRSAASLFGSLKAARHVAKQVRTAGRALGISKVAVVAKFDSAAEIGRFLGGA